MVYHSPVRGSSPIFDANPIAATSGPCARGTRPLAEWRTWARRSRCEETAAAGWSPRPMNPMATPDWQGIVTGRKEVDCFLGIVIRRAQKSSFLLQSVQDWLCGYGSIPIDTFLVGWTSIYQLFWGSLGTRVLTHPHVNKWFWVNFCRPVTHRWFFSFALWFCAGRTLVLPTLSWFFWGLRVTPPGSFPMGPRFSGRVWIHWYRLDQTMPNYAPPLVEVVKPTGPLSHLSLFWEDSLFQLWIKGQWSARKVRLTPFPSFITAD